MSSVADVTAPLALPASELERLRRRTVKVLVAGVALGSTGHIAAVTVGTIAAQHIAGTSEWAGAPAATTVLGGALGAISLSAVMVRAGRRNGLALGYVIGVFGAVLATLGVVALSLPLLLVGTVLIGFGNSSNQLSRYVVADLEPPNRRASAISVVVWAATVGAILGPNLVAPAGALAEAIGLPELAGPYLMPLLFVLPAAILTFAMLRPDPYALADHSSIPDEAQGSGERVAALLRRPAIAAALLALVTGQVVMVLIMTMTPLHMDAHGHTLASIGVVISGHVFGMFALSPISGRLTDRFGSPPVIFAGLAVLGWASVLAAVAPPDGGVLLFVALFLLGYGWNMGYVAGSAMLVADLTLPERTRLQGAADTLIWSSAAVASLSSGFVVSYASYAALGLLGAGLVIVPAWVITRPRSQVAAVSG
jgi:MFS family permease